MKPNWIALIVLTIAQAVPAQAEYFPNHVVLDCTGRATDMRGRARPYRQTFFVSFRTGRFCASSCGGVYALARWDAGSIDLSRQSPPMPPGSDQIDLNSYGMQETFNIRTGAFSGTEVTNGYSHQRLSVRGRCTMRPLDLRPVENFLDTATHVIPAPAPSDR
jgi:hypothetical protein